MDYTKLTVAQLRNLLKERHIPSTGLQRKTQIVEKLEEADRAATHRSAASSVTMGGGEDAPAAKEATPTVKGPTPAAAEAPTLPAKESTPPAKEPTSPAKEPTPPADPLIPTPKINPTTPPPADNETETVEKEMLPTVPEVPSIEPSVEPSRLNSEELEADTKKRKRRSESPGLKADDVKSKKLRASGEGLEPAVKEVVHIEKDVVIEDETENNVATDVVMEDKPAEAQIQEEESKEPSKGETKEGVEHNAEPTAATVDLPATAAETKKAESPGPTAERERDTEKENASRFKSLFDGAADATPPIATEADLERNVSPSLHPATPALYIRNFMRPLQPNSLKNHLVALASPASADPNPAFLKSFFLDPIRTHALVLFNSISAAARVRTAIHGAVWPAERDRKALWVDFIPEESVEAWIATEEGAATDPNGGRGTSAKRWEVFYYRTGPDGGLEAVHQEVGARPPRSFDVAAQGVGMPNAPMGQRGDALSNPTPLVSDQTPITVNVDSAKSVKPDPTKSFQTLDKLFSSTTAKPKLYFKPVDDARAEKRLDILNTVTSRNWDPDSSIRGRGRGPLDEKVRFGFEGLEDVLMEVGPDIGPGAAMGWGGRGGAGGFRGHGGGFRGGDSYRGGGMPGRLEREGEFRGGFRGGRGGWRGRVWD
jgi:hypothetical protein